MPAHITPFYFTTLFDEFSAVAPAKIQTFLDIASLRVSQPKWGDKTAYATALLAAHMLATSGAQGGGSSGGPVTAEQVGDVSRSYGTVGQQGSGDEDLRTTRYGIDFIALRKETIVPAMVTGTGVRPAGYC